MTSTATERIVRASVRFPEIWVALVPAVYVALVVSPPLLAAAGHPHVARGVFVCFRFFCHQRPERTLFLLGRPMAVCARCFALSAGLAAGALLAGRVRALREGRWRVGFVWVAVAMVPMAIDGFTQLFGWRESTNPLRVATGLLLGGMTALWAVPIVYDAFRDALGDGEWRTRSESSAAAASTTSRG